MVSCIIHRLSEQNGVDHKKIIIRKAKINFVNLQIIFHPSKISYYIYRRLFYRRQTEKNQI